MAKVQIESIEKPFDSPELAGQALKRITGISTGPACSLCQAEVRGLRREGTTGLIAPSAALKPGHAAGHIVHNGLQPGPPRDGKVSVLFGPRKDIVGWKISEATRPSKEILRKVRYL